VLDLHSYVFELIGRAPEVRQDFLDRRLLTESTIRGWIADAQDSDDDERPPIFKLGAARRTGP